MRIDQKALEILRAMHAQAKMTAQDNTDEQAASVPALYPDFTDFQEGDTIKAGMRVNYHGVLYNVIQTHQKQALWTPVNAPSLFAKVLIPDETEIPLWEQPDSTNPYKKGDKVFYNGKIWESLTDGNVWEPGQTGTEALWKEIQ